MRISDWSSDVCSSDLLGGLDPADRLDFGTADGLVIGDDRQHLGGGARQFARIVALAAQKMRKVGWRLEMPMPAALDEFDPASRMAPRDGLDDRLHLPGGHFIAEAPGDLPRVERFVAGEQHRLYRAFQIVDHARCSPLAAFR